MAKEIIPIKLIVALNEDGNFKSGVLQYQIRENGSINKKKFYTVGISGGIKMSDMNLILADTKLHAEVAEKITVKPIKGG